MPSVQGGLGADGVARLKRLGVSLGCSPRFSPSDPFSSPVQQGIKLAEQAEKKLGYNQMVQVLKSYSLIGSGSRDEGLKVWGGGVAACAPVAK